MLTVLNLNATNDTLFSIFLIAVIVACIFYVIGWLLGRWRP
jgi:hypothetical protein